MSWLKLDDGFASNKKVAQLSDRQLRVWMRLLCYCAKENDPTVDALVTREVAGVTWAFINRCHEIGLLDVSGDCAGDVYEVHDWESYQPTLSNAERQANWRARRNAKSNAQSNGEVTVPRARRNPVQSSPLKTEELKPSSTSVPTGDVQAVYDFWRTERGKTDKRYGKVSPKRRQRIQARLREFTVDELRQAIRGVALDPWEERNRHDDLTVIFRSREQVERFLDYADSSSFAADPEQARAEKVARRAAAESWRGE